MLLRQVPWRTVLGWFALLAAAAVVVVAGVYVVFWPVSDLIATHDVGAIIGPTRAAALQSARDAARGRLLTFGAGLFAAGALVYTGRIFSLSREGQVTNRYTSAIEQLGSHELEVRIGGVYVLERIARDSARDHPTVMEVLTAFVREHSPEQWPPATDDEPGAALPARATRPDIQAALTVIGRRNARRDRQPAILDHAVFIGADLTRTDLARADLSGAYFTRADLTGADLTRANLTGAHLTGAHLTSADLTSADLTNANLTGTILTEAHFTNALLDSADLSGAGLSGADLTRADLTGAYLTGAYLTGAYLTNANLTRADLTRANLTRTDLTGANLDGADLDGADLDGANLTGATLARTDLTGANLTNANLTSANLTSANLTNATLTNATLTNATLTSATLSGAALSGAALGGTIFGDALWPLDANVPEGWQRDTDSGRLKRAESHSGDAAAE